VTAEMEPRLSPPVKSQLFGNRARRPAHNVETRWKRRVHRIVVPAASTVSPRTGLISAVSGGLTGKSNAVVSDGATPAYDHNSHVVS